MKNHDESVKVSHNPNWLYISDHPYRILIIGGSRSDKSNVLLNLIKNQRPDIGKIYLYVKDPFESKYQLLIKGREKVRKIQKHSLIIHKQFMIPMKIWKTIIQQRKVLVMFDDMIANMEANIKFFLGGRKLNIAVIFIS